MRVLVSPDKFKGTLTAGQAASAIRSGWTRARPEDTVETVPLADGGEGTLDALIEALGGERRRAVVNGPLGDPVEAEFGIAEAPAGILGVVEMARASGLDLLAPSRRAPTRTTTRGTGELILHACRAGARRVLVCIGGSATNDGGAGMAQALGVRLLDQRGGDLEPGGAALLHLARIDLRPLDPAVAGVDFVVASDVDNPLLGPNGASAVYGPQKGAAAEDVALLDEALGHFAAVVHRDLGIDLRDVPGSGAAGGLGAGLMAFLGAHLRPGVEVVMEAVRYRDRMEDTDVVVTGEGSFDEQSLRGKVPDGVLRTAEEFRVPVLILAGRQDASAPDGAVVASLADRFGERAALERPRELLSKLAFEVASQWAPTLRGTRAVPASSPLDRTVTTPRDGKARSVARFADAASSLGLRAVVRRFPEETRTADDAARAIGCAVGQIVKSLVFMAGHTPFLALTSGANRADLERLARLMGVENVRRASPEEARQATGFAIGGTPPLGHPQPIRVLVDRDLLDWDEVWAAAGAPDAVFPIEPRELLRVSGGEVADFAAR